MYYGTSLVFLDQNLVQDASLIGLTSMGLSLATPLSCVDSDFKFGIYVNHCILFVLWVWSDIFSCSTVLLWFEVDFLDWPEPLPGTQVSVPLHISFGALENSDLFCQRDLSRRANSFGSLREYHTNFEEWVFTYLMACGAPFPFSG